LNNRDPKFHDIYDLDVRTGAKKLMFKNDRFSAFIFDNDLNLRLLKLEGDDASDLYYKYDPKKATDLSSLPLYRRVKFEDRDVTYPVAFNENFTQLYWLDNLETEDFGSLYSVDFETQKRTLIRKSTRQEPIVHITLHPVSLKLLSAITEYDRPKRVFFDQEYEREFGYLAGKMARQFNETSQLRLVAYSEDFSLWIFTPQTDLRPGMYYFYNRTDGVVKFMFPSEFSKVKVKVYFTCHLLTKDGYFHYLK